MFTINVNKKWRRAIEIYITKFLNGFSKVYKVAHMLQVANRLKVAWTENEISKVYVRLKFYETLQEQNS
jgi:hypothetical protein